MGSYFYDVFFVDKYKQNHRPHILVAVILFANLLNQITISSTLLPYNTKHQQLKSLADLVVHDQSINVLSMNNFILADLLCKAAIPKINITGQ